MRRLDRYILRQILGPFLFFVLVFTGVIWLSQSLRVIDTVVNSGQSARVFLEFTALLLPMVMSIVLPVSAFAAALWSVNRLLADSEIVVMFGAGMSAPSLLRPVAVFGLMVTVLLYSITLYLMPTAQREMRDRISEIRGDVAAAFLREGTFVSPVTGVTVYLREMVRPGEMLGIFVSDERDPSETVTYTAERAVLLRDGEGTRLVMFDGIAQRATGEAEPALSVLRFDRVAYDMTSFTDTAVERRRKPSELYLPELLAIEAHETGGRKLGEYRAEAHEALAGPLYALALPLLGVAMLVSAGFRRGGFALRIIGAVGAAGVLRISGLAAKSGTAAEAHLWPLMYAIPVIGMILAVWLLATQMGGRTRRRRAARVPA